VIQSNKVASHSYNHNASIQNVFCGGPPTDRHCNLSKDTFIDIFKKNINKSKYKENQLIERIADLLTHLSTRKMQGKVMKYKE
jgi:hypothetical protein